MGNLATVPALSRPDLMAPPVQRALAGWPAADLVEVAQIDPDLADTAAFCQAYQVLPEESANCVIVTGRREGVARHAACLVLATTRADVNNVVRRRLDVRKASFAPVDEAVELTGMQYGGITPLGLPAGWPVLVDRAVFEAASVVIGSGIRGSKLVLPSAALRTVPGVEEIDGLAVTAGRAPGA